MCARCCQPWRMANADGWSWTASPSPWSPEALAARGIRGDVASVAGMWVVAAYDDLRRAGPDRGARVRRILDGHVLPWFVPRTSTVGDITYVMVHEWLLSLVGRRPVDPEEHDGRPVLVAGASAGRERSLREAAEAVGVSLATARRRWRDGELLGAYRDERGHVRVPEPAVAALQRAKRSRPIGLSQPVVADALWVLRRVLAFARANGIVPPGFDPTEGLEAPRPDAADMRVVRPTAQLRPLTFPECARIASHLHPVHQLVLWLQRVMGLRISEAFGVLVDDVIDLGNVGLLVVQGQGGRFFRVRDDKGCVVTVTHKETMKTEAACRVLVVPSTMMELIRIAVDAFHTDSETSEVHEAARLVPGLRTDDESGQLSFRQAFEQATVAEGVGSRDLGFRVSPHLLHKSLATDLAWQPGIDGAVRRRFMGHRASDDVYGRVYTLDHPELAPLEEVARLLDDDLIRGSIKSLLVPTTRRVHWARSNRLFERAAAVDATLGAAGWMVDPGSSDEPLCDTQRVASELRIAPTTARRWMRDGTLNCVVVRDANVPPSRRARLSDAWSLRDRLADRMLLPDLAEQLGVRYHELYRMSRRLGMTLERHPTSRQFEVPREAAERLRSEHARVRALHERSMKGGRGPASGPCGEHGHVDGEARRARHRSRVRQQRRPIRHP